MKLGMFMMPLHPPHRPMHETYDEDLAKVVHADKVGFHEVWIGEHFTASTEPIANAMTFMAAALPLTKNIMLGTGVVNLPNHNPVIVAAEAAQFDHMAKGRFLFGIGPGGLASDFEVFDNEDPAARGEKMLEAYEAIRYIWASDPPYRFEGKHYNFHITENIIPEMGIGFMPKPYQQPAPDIGLSAMSPFSGSVKQAASKGWSPISANFVPEYSVASHWQKFLEGCEEAGIAPDGNRWRVARNIIIADSDAEAEDLAHDPKGSTHYYFDYLWKALCGANYSIAMKPDPKMADEDVKLDDVISQLVIYGSKETVTDKLVAFRENVGPFGTLLQAAVDGSGKNGEAERRTMAAMSDYVMPRLAGALVDA